MMLTMIKIKFKVMFFDKFYKLICDKMLILNFLNVKEIKNDLTDNKNQI